MDGFKKKKGSKIQKVKIGRSTYKILICDLIILNGDQCLGLCDTEIKYLYIQYSKNKELMKETLLHELTHAILDESHVHCSNWSSELEEIVCEAIAKNIAPLINFSNF